MGIYSINNTTLFNSNFLPTICINNNTPISSSIVTHFFLPRRNHHTVINSLSLLTAHNHHQQKKKTSRAAHLAFTVRASAAAPSLELPLLPFPLHQVLVPTESKTLHMYEARDLKLLGESLNRKSKLFVHLVLEPFDISSISAEASFAAKYGCLAFIEKIEPLDGGALVTIRGIGRVTLVKFVKADPYLEGIVVPLQDDVPENTSEINAKTLELTMALQNLDTAEISFKMCQQTFRFQRSFEQLMQQSDGIDISDLSKLPKPDDTIFHNQTRNALKWLEEEPSLDSHEAFIPSMAERVSFAALQVVTGSFEMELEKLQEEKVKAMDGCDTLERLQNSLKLAEDNHSVVLAKIAIVDLSLHPENYGEEQSMH